MWILLVATLTTAGPTFTVGLVPGGQDDCHAAMRAMHEDDLSEVRKALEATGVKLKAWQAYCMEFRGEGETTNGKRA